jgi:hypothetical protein
LLLSGQLITAAWYRWRDCRTSRSTPLRGYLATGPVLAAATAALPLLSGLGMLLVAGLRELRR